MKEQLKLMKELTKKFSSKYEFCNGDINKSILTLRKGVYLHDYMDSWERFNQIYLPDKKAFYRELILEDISYEDYIHAQKVFEEFNIKYLGEYHDLYLKTDVLLLADVFENFREMCLYFYELDPIKFFSAPGLASKMALKKIQVKLDLSTDIVMLLMVEKGIRGKICNIVYHYAKANKICMAKIKNRHTFNTGM